MEIKEKTLYLFQSTQHKTTNYFIKTSFSLFQDLKNATKTNIPQKRFCIFPILTKHAKLLNKNQF